MATPSGASQTFVVAVDGSETSKACFDAAAKLYRRGYAIHVLHVADPHKTYLPFESTPAAIEEAFKVKCITRFPSSAWRVIVKSKPSGRETRDVIVEYVRAKETAADVLFVGWVGRKGPKDDPTILGSNTDYSLRAAHCSAFVVKTKEPLPETGAVIVVGVDGSARAHETVDKITRFIARPGDKVILVHVVEGTGSSATLSAAAVKHDEATGLAGSSAAAVGGAGSSASSAAGAAATAASISRHMLTPAASGGPSATAASSAAATPLAAAAASAASALAPIHAISSPQPLAAAGSLFSPSAASGAPMTAEAIEARYKDYATMHPSVSYVALQRDVAAAKEVAAGVADILVDFAEEHVASILAVGVDGMGRYTHHGAHTKAGSALGSVSDAVVRKSRCDVLVVQPARGTY